MKSLLRVINLILLILFVIGICSAAILTRENLWTVPVAVGITAWFVVLGSSYTAGDEEALQSTRDIAWWSNLAFVLVILIGAATLIASVGIDSRLYGALVLLPAFVNLLCLHKIQRDEDAADAANAPSPTDSSAMSHDASTLGYSEPPTSAQAFIPLQFVYTPEDETAGNYFSRHWRGYLSLPVAYWVNGLLLALALFGVIKATQLYTLDASLRTSASIALAVLCLVLTSSVWSSVGIWRSAVKHPSRGGSRLWAGLAQALIALTVLVNAVQFEALIWPQIKELTRIAFDQDSLRRIRAEPRDDGTTLVLKGDFGTGSYNEVKPQFDALPALRTVVLDSHGGRIREAAYIAGLVRERKLDTVVNRYCESACTMVFLAGTQRTLSPYSRLGFHRASLTGIDDKFLNPDDNEMMTSYRKSGLDESFLAKVRATPSWSMWYPNSDELLGNKLISSAATVGDALARLQNQSGTAARRRTTTPSFVPPRAAPLRTPTPLSKAELARQYRSVRALAQLDERFPGTIESAASSEWETYQKRGVLTDSRKVAHGIVSSKVPLLLATADDATLDSFLTLMLEQLEFARGIGFQTCSQWLMGTLDLSHLYPPGVLAREGDWLEHAIRSRPLTRDPPSEDILEGPIQASLGALSAEHREVVANIPAFSKKPELQCTAVINLYRRIAALPPQDRALVLRSMYQARK